jgi:hypothetical protein
VGTERDRVGCDMTDGWGFLLGLILWHRYHGMDEDLSRREGFLGSVSLVWEVSALRLLRVLGIVVVRERRKRR